MFTSDGSKIPDAPNKDPDSSVDYGCDWAAWLKDGESISLSEWLPVTGLTQSNSLINGAITAVTLDGGTIGERYKLTNRITTSLGRTEDRSMFILCKGK